MNIFLQIFLFFDVFVLGVVLTIASRHAYAHFRPGIAEPENPTTHHQSAPQSGHLPPAMREHILEEAQEQFEKVLKRAAGDLEKDLESSASHIKQMLDTHGAEIIGRELQHYKTRLADLAQETEAGIKNLDTQLDQHQTDLKAKLAEEFAAEKQKLLAQLDTKLADAVGSFLTEVMQHNIDLGAQSDYLVSVLEEHKDELIKEVADGSST